MSCDNIELSGSCGRKSVVKGAIPQQSAPGQKLYLGKFAPSIRLFLP